MLKPYAFHFLKNDRWHAGTTIKGHFLKLYSILSQLLSKVKHKTILQTSNLDSKSRNAWLSCTNTRHKETTSLGKLTLLQLQVSSIHSGIFPKKRETCVLPADFWVNHFTWLIHHNLLPEACCWQGQTSNPVQPRGLSSGRVTIMLNLCCLSAVWQMWRLFLANV